MSRQIISNFKRERILPLYEQIATHLSEKIVGGVFSYGEQLPSELALSAQLGCSRETLRKSLKALEARRLITQHRGKGTFVSFAPEPDSTKKRIGITTLIGENQNSSDDSYSSLLTSGIKDSFNKHTHEFVYIQSVENIPESVQRHNLDGVIIINPEKKLAKRLSMRSFKSIPHVFVSVKYDFLWEGDFFCIDTDNVGGAKKAIEHLLALGHGKIAFLGSNPETSNSIDRLKGYKLVLEKHKIDLDQQLIAQTRTGLALEDSYEATLSFLKMRNKPSAIFASGFNLALSAMKAARDLGLSIPDDISIVSFDDYKMCDYLTPSLTTVKQPVYDLGSRAGEMLISQICNKSRKARNELLPTELIVRKSCGVANK